MRHLIVLMAAASTMYLSVAILLQQTDGNGTGRVIKVAMGPVSAPQKRGPPVAGPGTDPPGCKRSGRNCKG
jgi:preprotein translocase subunit SecG